MLNFYMYVKKINSITFLSITYAICDAKNPLHCIETLPLDNKPASVFH
jgi:hypothetical protein